MRKKWFTLIELMVVITIFSIICIWLYTVTLRLVNAFKENESMNWMINFQNKITTEIQTQIYSAKEIIMPWVKCEWRLDWDISIVNRQMLEKTNWEAFSTDPRKTILLCWDDWKLIAMWIATMDINWNKHQFFWVYKNREIRRIWAIDLMTESYRNSKWVNKESTDKILLWKQFSSNYWFSDFWFYYDWYQRDWIDSKWIDDKIPYTENIKRTAPKIFLKYTIDHLVNKKHFYTNWEETFIF